MSAKHSEHGVVLERFREAQDGIGSGFESALREILDGSKQGHWIWYVFPQLSGLGGSTLSQAYGIRGLAEAEEYLRDPELRSRLLAITTAVAGHVSKGASLETLMGSSIDARKLVSSLTLFGHVARTVHSGEGKAACEALARLSEDVLDAAALQGYARCQYTLDRLTPTA